MSKVLSHSGIDNRPYSHIVEACGETWLVSTILNYMNCDNAIETKVFLYDNDDVVSWSCPFYEASYSKNDEAILAHGIVCNDLETYLNADVDDFNKRFNLAHTLDQHIRSVKRFEKTIRKQNARRGY